MRSLLSIVDINSWANGSHIESPFLTFHLLGLPVFSSSRFIVSCFTFRSLIHLEFIFPRVIDIGLISFLYIWTPSFLSTTCWRCCFFPNVYFWHLCKLSDSYRYMCPCFSLIFCSTGLYICFYNGNILFLYNHEWNWTHTYHLHKEVTQNGSRTSM